MTNPWHYLIQHRYAASPINSLKERKAKDKVQNENYAESKCIYLYKVL